MILNHKTFRSSQTTMPKPEATLVEMVGIITITITTTAAATAAEMEVVMKESRSRTPRMSQSRLTVASEDQE